MKIRLLSIPNEEHEDTYRIEKFNEESGEWELFKFPIDYRYVKEQSRLEIISSVTTNDFKCTQSDINLFYNKFKVMEYIKDEDGIKFYYKLRPKLESDKDTGIYPGEFTYVGYIPDKAKIMSLKEYLLSKSKVIDEVEREIPC